MEREVICYQPELMIPIKDDIYLASIKVDDVYDDVPVFLTETDHLFPVFSAALKADKGRDSPIPLCSRKKPPGELHPDLGLLSI